MRALSMTKKGLYKKNTKSYFVARIERRTYRREEGGVGEGCVLRGENKQISLNLVKKYFYM